jgi:hypothetical protein
MLGGTSAIAGGTPGTLGYYPPVSAAVGGLGPSGAVVGPGGLPIAASAAHGLARMTNIQVPATVFPNSNFTVLTVFTYGGADVANYSTRITIPGLGVMNNMSQSASVTGGGGSTVQNTIATPAVLPYGPIPGTVELVRNGGVLIVDDVQPITINSPGGVGVSGTIPIPPGPYGIPPQPFPTPPGPTQGGGNPPPPPSTGGGTPTIPPPSGGGPPNPPAPGDTTPPPPTLPPPTTTPGSIVVAVTRTANAGKLAFNATGSGFTPMERVQLIFMVLPINHNNAWRQLRNIGMSHKVVQENATAQGQVMHTFTTNANITTGQVRVICRMHGLSSHKHGTFDHTI